MYTRVYIHACAIRWLDDVGVDVSIFHSSTERERERERERCRSRGYRGAEASRKSQSAMEMPSRLHFRGREDPMRIHRPIVLSFCSLDDSSAS
jgi:hypothetical protein